MNKKYALIGLAAVVIIAGGIVFMYREPASKPIEAFPPDNNVILEYNPVIKAEDFVSGVDNKYFTLEPGTKFTYESDTMEGKERIEVEVTRDVKVVMGITANVVWDRVWLDNVLIEDTLDWYAQDKEGNVWYFGKEADNYENGVIKDHEGTWQAGVDGSKPGIIMKANPQSGDTYRQEYYPGHVENGGEVISLNEEVTVPYGTFQDCLKTRDWSEIDPSANEYKYYCPEVGFVVMEEAVIGGGGKLELISVSTE